MLNIYKKRNLAILKIFLIKKKVANFGKKILKTGKANNFRQIAIEIFFPVI